MDDQAKAIGDRVRYWRRRRNLGRKHFADMVGRSASWVDKIEKGERALLRLPMLERVAEVLNIDPAVLTDQPAAERAARCVDPTEVQAIRSALGSYPGLAPAEPPAGTFRITQQADYLDAAWAASHFTVVARHLPTLITAAQNAVPTATGDERLGAHRMLVTTYRLASSMLLKFEASDLAWLAADRAMHAALAADDTWALARATRSVARAMTGDDQRPQAIGALLAMADRMRPQVTVDADHLLALYGMLYLAASTSAAQGEDAGLALEMHRDAAAAAQRLQPEHNRHNTFFEQANVDIHRVSALVRLHEHGRALEYARTIDPTSLAGLPPERRANHLLDLTEANAKTGHYRPAVQTLRLAEQIAPEEVRCRPLAHGLLRLLLRNTNGEHGRLLSGMAERAGVAA
ncbi:helix-turn-helix domain-containing protein [Amycolatopsis nigrescens]|uniref:helix-turn-helix domain-containing protein n=1 Tax=Amycolatopsis nigrescens TaxID=381445 RepID=UPI00035EAB0C|nr:helix-turn-helix transcriptional regulator [Amycolatopsis nigrescens]